MATALKALLQQRHLQEHRAFCREYDRSARVVDRELVGSYPSKATFYRWLSGQLTGQPHPSHCRVLEKMVPGWTVQAMFQPWDEDAPPEAAKEPVIATALAGVTAVHTSRVAFSQALPVSRLFDEARSLDAVGLSLNLLCQQYPNANLRALLHRASVRLLFLDPDGEAVKQRNLEEGHETGHLSALSRGNINIMSRLREELDPAGEGNVELRTYDETIRLNLMFIDSNRAIMQPYLPDLRGLDSPTFVMQRTAEADLYSVFSNVFSALWERGAVV
jgi:Domain of unknown function (DUF5919)